MFMGYKKRDFLSIMQIGNPFSNKYLLFYVSLFLSKIILYRSLIFDCYSQEKDK